MNTEKDEDLKKLQVRLPRDEYVKLKYLAAHHGSSMNSEVLSAINLAEKEARKTGLSIPTNELSAKALRENFTSPFQEMLESYWPSTSLMASPEENVRKILVDWLGVHAQLRVEIFSLGLQLELMDRLIQTIQKSDYAFEAEANPNADLNDLQRALLKTGGFPGLRDAYQTYMDRVEQLLPKLKNSERVKVELDNSIHVMRKRRSEQANG